MKRFLYGIRCRILHRWAPWCYGARLCWSCCETYPKLSCERFSHYWDGQEEYT